MENQLVKSEFGFPFIYAGKMLNLDQIKHFDAKIGGKPKSDFTIRFCINFGPYTYNDEYKPFCVKGGCNKNFN